MRTLILTILLTTAAIASAQKTTMKSIYDFKVKTLDGKEFDMASLKGKKLLIVNTASECGYTPQYAELEELYKKYKAKNFEVIGFPSNQFGEQEPGTDEQIKAFCQKNYNVTFPMMSKIDVKGENAHPLYRYLTHQIENGVLDSEVKWNFQKYLVDENGKLVKVVKHSTSPMDQEIINWIESK